MKKLTQKQFNQIIDKLSKNYFYFLVNADWGQAIHISCKQNKAIARVYWYYKESNNEKSVILDNLYVKNEYRGQKIETELQIIREIIATELNANCCYLWANKNNGNINSISIVDIYIL